MTAQIGRIGVDLDGVVADFQGTWIRKYELWFDRKVDADLALTWDCLLTGTHFETTDEFWAWTDVANVWGDMDPVPGALGGLYTLRQLGFSITFITSRHQNAKAATTAWLNRLLPHGFFRWDLNFTPAKWAVPCQVYIDDHDATLDGLRQAGKITIRYKRPWNSAKATMVAANWDEIVALLKATFDIDQPTEPQEEA